MPVESKEVSQFISGLIGSSSETDLKPDFATFSLDIDSDFEKGALRGIKGNYILGNEGWELPRYAMWRMRMRGSNDTDLDNDLDQKAFVLHGYNKSFLIYFDDAGAATYNSSLENWATENNFTIVIVNTALCSTTKKLIQQLASVINSLVPPNLVSEASGISNYFTAVYTQDAENRKYIVIKSNFLGDISKPESPEGLYVDTNSDGTPNLDYRTHSADFTTANIIFPDEETFEVVTGPNFPTGFGAWNSDVDGFFVKGNGLLPNPTSDNSPLGFKFLYPINQKGSSNLFGITEQSKAILLKNVGVNDPESNLTNLGNISSSSSIFDISAEQRNANLYIGTGSGIGNNSLWFGKINRKQLNKNFNDEHFLLDSSIEPINQHSGPISVDNLIVPTLHYGLNSTNGGIAGAANIYCNSGGVDDSAINNPSHERTVSNWIIQCLTNASISNPTLNATVKKGMVFRLDLGGAFSTSINTDVTTYNGTNEVGVKAGDFLMRLKALAKGHTNREFGSSIDTSIPTSTAGGSDSEQLHTGDLFQVVYVPSATNIDVDAEESNNGLIRLAYVGYLTGDYNEGYGDGTDDLTVNKHNSEKAYSGSPAYSFGHVDNSGTLYRIKNTSKKQSFITEELEESEISITASDGSSFNVKNSTFESVDLSDELGIEGFQIGTIAEAKSCDGSGGFGGETTNKNYFMGYGKLWISNINEYNKLYLVDISNWDRINSEDSRLSYTEVTLNFDRIHNKLFSTDYTGFGEGLVRLWYHSYGTSDYDDLIGNYQWVNEPNDQYISSICETYSHKPHLGDGAGSGVAVGDGKWRVWVSYNKENDLPHSRWDLFLYNFRPQGINPTSDTETSNIQGGIGAANNGSNTVYMYDKTPPYQECAEITLGLGENAEYGHNKVCYPYDKFSFSKVFDSAPPANTFHEFNDGTSKRHGGEWLGITGGAYRREHFGTYDDSQAIINFRNPSGEFMTWKVFYGSEYGVTSNMDYNFQLGRNIGWLSKEGAYRNWTNTRHCMRPHFKEWYFTGVTGKKTTTELTNPVAHIVSFFGTLSGSFIKDGGRVQANNDNGGGLDPGTVSWYATQQRELDVYNDDIVMWTMHDSPVAFSHLSETDGTGNATFTNGETQGAPNVDKSNPTDPDTSAPNLVFNDTEAGWLTDNSVPATIGYSRFNQYRFAHGHNGSAELNEDTGFQDESVIGSASTLRHGYVNTRHYTSANEAHGCAYYGQDGLGHYNMITTTWASNQEPILRYRASGAPKHIRLYGYGFEKWVNYDRDYNKDESGLSSFNGMYYPRNGESEATMDNMAQTKFGTGYLTYKWPHTSDGANGGDTQAGFYSASTDVDIPENYPGKDPSGKIWDNRKSVFCWSTTALSDSVFKNIDTSLGKFHTNLEFNHLISPRCSFRRVELPSGYQFQNINNVDFISWQQINGGTTITRHGYIISGKAQNSPVKDIDTSSVIACVIDNKSISSYKKEGKNDDTDSWLFSQTLASIAPVTPLVKQYMLGSENFLNQIVSYTNDYLMFKNLNQGLSDSPIKYNTSNKYEQRTLRAQDSNWDVKRDLLLDCYSPIIIGNTGDNSFETISIWNRPQFGTNNSHMVSLGLFPYYKYDRLWNFWSEDSKSPNNGINTTDFETEAGFDNAVLDSNSSILVNKRPTEGYGSTAGTMIASSPAYQENKYPYGSSLTTGYDDVDNSSTGLGSHTKILKEQLITFMSFEPAPTDSDGVTISYEFKQGEDIYYKFTFLYDNFQESPLSSFPFIVKGDKITGDAKYIRLKLKLPNAEQLKLSPRVTHFNVYRKTNQKALYRLVKSISLNGEDDVFSKVDGNFELNFNDEKVGVSYEGLNGVSETLSNFTPNYALSCQLNDFLFIADIHHPKLEEGKHILLRSLKGKFSIFDWSTNFLDLPTRPTAIASFANRVFLFDDNNTYIINPHSMHIEERSTGTGILNSKAFVVTDIGLFFADRNNIYVHNGKSANPIGGPILYNHSRPEWQIGYLDALKKAENLGYTPRLEYDSIKKCIYIILQGYTDASTSDLSSSYETNKSRIYSYNIQTRRWDYYSSPNVKTSVVTSKGDVILSDGYQLYNYRVDKRNRKSFNWESKEFIMGSSNYEKSFKRLYVTGELCLWDFNNSANNPIADNEGDEFNWGGGTYLDDDANYTTEDNTHLLETSSAAETDDLKVYVDGVLQTMRIQSRKPHVGHYLANDKTGSIYKIETALPTFETADNGVTDVDGNELKNAFTIFPTSVPEFIEPPNSQYQNVTHQGELSQLVHIQKGQYLSITGTDLNGIEHEEFIKTRSIFFKYDQDETGKNTISSSNSIIITSFRGQLSSKAINWKKLVDDGGSINPIRIATPVLRFPSGTKGKNVKIVFNNQKSYIDSFAVTYRRKKMK
tara:strand:- start:1942 stop:9084 length:7143 start_codon:yes stop_codon:yes gene_type:complete